MKTYKTLKEIALDILRKYKNAEETVIYEYSGSIEEDIDKHSWECEILRMQIEELAEPKWTPVTERLPENMHRVLIAKRIIDEETVVDIGWYFAGEKTWYTNEFEVADVVAWQTLPEPYHPEEGQE